MKIKYILIKDRKYKKYDSINTNILFKVKNKKEFVGTINFCNDELSYKVIKRKIDNNFKKLLELFIKIEEDDNPTTGYMLCLDEADKFRKELNNKYQKHLKKEQIELFNKKISLIEKEIQNKLLLIRLNMINKKIVNQEDIEENEISHHR